MMLDYHILDVFTDRAFAGNPLAVVLEADGLSPSQMLVLAREFNLSETIFVQRPANPAHAARVRIFFPTAEIPFAGHPTIGCALLLAELRGIAAPATLVLEEEAGPVPVRLGPVAGGVEAELTAPVTPHPVAVTVDAGLAAAALGLPVAALGRPAVHAGGPAFLFVPLRDLAALGAARPCEPHWSALMVACGVDSAYLWVEGPEGIRARMFSPTAGIPEDPATGSATAILASVLAPGLAEGSHLRQVVQGVEMGRESRLRLGFDIAGGALTAARVAGRAVRVAQGRIGIPEGK